MTAEATGATPRFTAFRRWAILLIGMFGLVAEILTPADARPILLVTDLILVGIVPVEVFLHSRFRNGAT